MSTPESARSSETDAPAGATGAVIASARGLVKAYGRGEMAVQALAGIDVDFARGELTTIMGPPGSGKSTLMRCNPRKVKNS